MTRRAPAAALSTLALLSALLLGLPGCGHEVEPTAAYRTPESIPVPTLLAAEPGCFGTLIQWVAPDRDFEIIQGWFVYKQRPDGAIVRLTPVPSKQRSFVDNEEPEDGGYRYWATALSRGNVESGRSNEARFAIELGAPATPLDLVAVPSPSQVLLQWRRGSLAIGAGYFIYRDGERLGGVGDPDMPAFVDVQVRPGQTFRYRVTAVDCRGTESVPTPEVTVTIPEP